VDASPVDGHRGEKRKIEKNPLKDHLIGFNQLQLKLILVV